MEIVAACRALSSGSSRSPRNSSPRTTRARIAASCSPTPAVKTSASETAELRRIAADVVPDAVGVDLERQQRIARHRSAAASSISRRSLRPARASIPLSAVEQRVELFGRTARARGSRRDRRRPNGCPSRGPRAASSPCWSPPSGRPTIAQADMRRCRGAGPPSAHPGCRAPVPPRARRTSTRCRGTRTGGCRSSAGTA